MRLSIIVPVYNVESYLRRCLEACVQQDIPSKDFEIIVINDGSTDQSLSIAEEFAVNYTNVKVYSQENGGLSRARNAGLEKAQGEYVWFVDADDAIAGNCLGAICRQCISRNLDILAICCEIIRDNGTQKLQYYDASLSETVMSGSQMLRQGLLKSACSPFFICKRSYLEDGHFRFMPGVYHEDEEWTPRVCYGASRIGFTDACNYHLYIRIGSIMSTPNPKRALDIMMVAESLHQFGLSIPVGDRCLISKRITEVLNGALKQSLRYSDDGTCQFQEALYERRSLLKHFGECGVLKFRLEGFVLGLFPRKSVYVYRFLHRVAASFGFTEKPKGRGN